MVIDVKKLIAQNKKLKEKKSKLSLKKLNNSLRKRMGEKRILKDSEVTVKIKEQEPAEYVSRYFKNEWEETKRSLFMK